MRQKDVVEDIEILQQLELLEHEPDVPDAEVAARAIVQTRHVDTTSHHLPGLRHHDAGHQME